MNKRFSTLLAAALVAGGLSANAQDVTPVKINGVSTKAVTDPATGKAWGVGPYFVIADRDGNGEATNGDILLSVSKNSQGQLVYTGKKMIASTNVDLDQVSWYFGEEVGKDAVTEKPSTYHYTLKNKGLGTFLAANSLGVIITDPEKTDHKIADGQYAKFTVTVNGRTQFKQGGNLYIGGLGKGYGFQISEGNISSIRGFSNDEKDYKIILCELETKQMTSTEVAALNDVKGGEGFNLEYKISDTDPWKNDILKDLNLKAFSVSAINNIDGNTSLSIPAGVYFATEYPAELNGKDAISSSELDLFKQCTFIAIDPEGNYDIHEADRASGIGYELKTVVGSEMNFFNGARTSDDFSAASEVYVGNACFQLEIPAPMTAPEKFQIKAPKFHVFVSAKDNAKKIHVEMTDKYVGVINDQNENYLVTNTEGLDFKTTNSTIMDGDDLVETFLNTENAASIYTIQFVSGETKDDVTEFEQYLTFTKKGSTFALASTVEYKAIDPAYQFVVTALDKDKKTITFTNRLTKQNLIVQLYKNEEGVYTVYSTTPSAKVLVEWYDENTTNAEVEFKEVTLTNTEIVLTPCTDVDKFATFVNRADDMGLVQFELAKSTVSSTAFYLGGEQTEEGELKESNAKMLAYVDADDATQFELIKSEKPEAVINKYIYLKDNRIVTGGNDSVAYYSYKVRVFNPAELDEEQTAQYLMIENNSYQLLKKKLSEATKFIIKENIDGSVALISNVDMEIATVNYAEVRNEVKKDKVEAWGQQAFYSLERRINEGLKTFMVEEAPAVSYEAVPQHVSFAAVRGGFLTMDEDNNARLAIATEASEDLTFWLDTVKSDRQIPSFYITKGGNFLYNAIDSAKYYNARENYRYNLENKKYEADAVIAKLIFKAGELISSDTLQTVVDNKTVLVAEKDNAPKKIKGGLADFQFQIILADDADDEYLIRQGNKYVCQYNNYFYLNNDKKEAYRFTIEKQSAPTANEGIATSEVKVIAGEGNVTIAGAAGKKVVISNILGQVVANTVVSSDNATIAAPAGVVVVAVEGEAAVKAIVK